MQTSKKHFSLTIELGNDAMHTAEDIARALHKAADSIMRRGAYNGTILDVNGNRVGSYTVIID